ncbi:PilZ domain-containing protein [Rhodopseudomonas palustris]|uniref:PilZ domain-containing protein n=1 Tax=Rhodopseudomonas palustris TaxID=1076 RepID=A0A418UXI8_RHOPL|nr:PilZ domain-containing protein [Rhodopseudomonas palustris]RJF65657.1 PilZ domain-containing protein [Rhodopseudomonas palustris]
MVYGDRKDPRVKFEKLIDAVLIGVDGTWSRACGVADISATGARLVMKSPMAGLNFNEFFLVLTPAGRPYRRCQLVRIDGQVIGVRFIASS